MEYHKTNVNREYKNSVFTLLFGEKKNLLELYNAINGTNYLENTGIEIITLSNALYMEQINDIAFVLDGKLVVLMEHQSAINENMPLRMLLYMAREYEKLTNRKDLYRKIQIKVPTPEFIVLYNGDEKYPKYRELKLSDTFKTQEKEPYLELIVRVYNINRGENPEIERRSETLSGYEEFTAEIKKNYQETEDLAESIHLAVRTCIGRNILVNFLETHSSEVENMILTEWNTEEAIEVAKEEGFSQGELKGKLEQAREMAKGLLADGVPVSIVVKNSGLSEEEIARL
ncbi:MAG: Rpn family recombination-promoting nuclease/putative transposase [Fibrobacter sp.]|jgi:predicted transposase/invertase (TIGR01784 family)|nr:Rpn family recombination-promoting nuclease/putative transposase [Fibrobacter sp.]